MLKRLIYTSLSRTLIQPMHRQLRGMTLGVRGLVRDAGGRVLLVRHTYSPGWLFPGGGVERGESMEQSLSRELREEAGIEIEERAKLFAIYSNHASFPGDHVALYLVERYRRLPWQPDSEIADARFFAADELPADTTGGTLRRLQEVADDVPPAAEW